MFKSGVTSAVYRNFLESYQSLKSSPQQPNTPFVYVDENTVKLVTEVVSYGNSVDKGVFAVSVAEDGWMEFLAFNEN